MGSPIEIMIDRATGFDRSARTIRLQCSECDAFRVVHRHETDLDEAVAVVYLCPQCAQDVPEPEDVRYFDARGREVTP